ncbi:hypothetical protein BgiMline_017607 [Biomphalaria glabrata]
MSETDEKRELRRRMKEMVSKRAEQDILSQFRVGHCLIGLHLLYFGRFKENHDTRCFHCRDDEETTDLIFSECRLIVASCTGQGVE